MALMLVFVQLETAREMSSHNAQHFIIRIIIDLVDVPVSGRDQSST